MRNRHGIILVLLSAFAPLLAVKAQQQNSVTGVSEPKTPTVQLAHFAAAPTIDGQLDEAEWKQAAVLDNFRQTQPGDNTAPSYPTRVLLGYDNKFLYIAVQATDNPNQVRATVARRDAITADDYVAIYLDTFNDQRKAYALLFNPLGVQQDGIFTEGREIDFSVDLVMQSKGVITRDGWTIEVAVPFNSLRYEAGSGKQWGMHIVRVIKHLDEENSWMPLRREMDASGAQIRASFLAQAGHLTGLNDISAERTLELIPTLTLSETANRVRTILPPAVAANPSLDDPGRLVNRPVDFVPGLTSKITLSSGVTLNLALNPDFGEVEADQPQVTVNQRYPLFFEERRPFFLEGIDIFNTPIQAVHTRTIIDPDIAVKLSGKRGSNTFGLMMASDNAPGNFSEEERKDSAIRPAIERFIDKNACIGILRLKHDIGQQSSIGLIATSYDFIENHNHLLGIDGRISINPQTIFTFQMIGTISKLNFYNPDLDQNVYRTGKGVGYYTRLERSGRHLNVTVTGRGFSRDYRANVGFISQTNTNPWDLLIRYNSEPRENARFISWSVASATRAQFDWKGRMQYSYQSWRTQLNFKRQTYLKTDVYTDYQRLFEEEYGARRSSIRPGAFTGAPERSTVWKGFTIEGGTAPTKKYSGSIAIDYSWKAFDYDLGALPRFPRVSPAALLDPNAPFDPGPGDTFYIEATFNYQPTDSLRLSMKYTKSSLVRTDTNLVAFNQDIYSLRTLYQFTRFTFARARIDFDSVSANARAQFLFGWTPNPGTAFYVGYNDDLNYNGYNRFTGHYEPGLTRNGRTFFIKMSYLFRHRL